jgi:carbon-monoxide dehydrogenase medium subunit
MPALELLRPASLKEAAALLLEHGEDALALAGGTALVLLLRQRLIAPHYLVDLGAIPGHRGIDWSETTGARIGALATLRAVERSPVVQGALPLLAEAYAAVGNVRVRHAATVGGNLAHGDYRLDPPAALLALDARLTITDRNGDRELPLAGFLRGFERTALEPGELISALAIPPLPPGSAGAYVKFSSLAADGWPCVGAAAVVALDGGDRIAVIRIAVTAVGPTPQLIPEVAALAVGRVADVALIQEIGAVAATRVSPIEDLLGTAWYKRQVTAATVGDALQRAVDRARASRLRQP